MSTLEDVLRQPATVRLGWTLAHFLWQGTLIAAAYAAARGIGGRFLSARGRYALACAALAAMVAAPPITFLLASFVAAAPAGWTVTAGPAWERALPWLVVGWVAGVTFFSVRLICGWRVALRLRRVAVAAVPSEWHEALDALMARMRVSAPVRLLASSLAATPTVVGWLKPVILVPAEMLTGLPAEQLRALLAHELAHILRRDYLVNVLQSVAEAALFYHPAVWWVSERIRAEREACCDDLAVEVTGDALVYASALADLETRRRERLEMATAADGGSLVSRIRRLAGQAEPVAHTLPGAAAAWAMSLLWLAGVGAVLAHGAHVTDAAGVNPARRPFVPPASAAAPATVPIAPPLRIRAAAAPLAAALLFDPFFAMPQAPPRPGGSAEDEEKRLAGISGTVFTTAGKPVANATVRLRPANTAQSGSVVNTPTGPVLLSGSAQTIPATRTDAEGKFTLGRIPPGSYTLEFQHKDYLTAAYGARPGIQESGTVVTLDEGRTLSDIRMTLPETAAFFGRTVDQDGDPVAHADVQVLVTQYYYGRQRGLIVARTSSKDNGEFRVSIRPGRYYLVATTQPAWTAADRAPIPAVKPGQKYVRPDLTYFPGAREFSGAVPVDIAPGQDFNVGDFKMISVPIVHVRGKVVGDPALLKGSRVLRVPVPGIALGWSFGADIRPDGSFDMANMYCCRHTIGVYSMNSGFLGWTDILVRDEDLEDVFINATAANLSGSVIAEGGPAGLGTPETPMRIELLMTAFLKVSFTANVKPDGTFLFPSVAPGTYFVNVTGLARDNYVKTARINARDVLNQPLEWGGLDKGPLEIVISAKAPVLEGSVMDADGNPVSGTVTLVPDPPRPGPGLLYPTAKADQRGKFRFHTVAPGSYKVFAWETILDTAHWASDFIEPFTSAGERIELKQGEQKTIVLKRISAESMATTLRRAGK